MKPHATSRPLAALVAVLVVMLAAPAALAGSIPGPGAGVDRPATEAPSPILPSGIVPSVHYEDAMAHANDATVFEAGGRVVVPFTPRPDDQFSVGGRAPVSLPAGAATGATLLERARNGGPSDRGPIDLGPAPVPVRPGSTYLDQSLPDPSRELRAAPVSASLAPAPADPTLNAVGLRREVFGFLPYWEVSDSSTTFNYDVLSTIAYFSVGANQYGNLMTTNSDGSPTTGWSGWTSSKMTSVINAAHQNGTRVVLTISCFAWTSTQATTQATLLGSPDARTNLARQIVAAVRDRGADGVNLDFEPVVSGYADAFTALVREIRATFDAAAPGYQITFDTTGRIENYPIEAATAPGGADAIFIMGYDYRTSGSGSAGSISPLTGPVYDLTDTIEAYAARVPASKLILGVPYYGRAWSTVSDALHSANISGTQYGTSVSVTYGTAIDFGTQYGRRWDPIEQAPWTVYQKQTCTTTYGCMTAWRQLYYDDAASLKLRYDLVNRTGLRGVGIWALGYDGTRPELYQALGDKFLRDTTPPLVGISALAPTQENAGFQVSWTAWDDSTIAGYDVQVATDGGAWTDWLVGSQQPSEFFLGLDGHTYAFRVRATDSHGNASGWSMSPSQPIAALSVGGFARTLVDGLSMRSAPSTSATFLGTLSAGTILTILGGPVTADGSTWYQVQGPILEWQPVSMSEIGFWVAATAGPIAYLEGRVAPNVTTVRARMAGYTVGVGTDRQLTPDGDGSHDVMPISWTNRDYLDSLAANVYRADLTLAGSIPLPLTVPGPQTWSWDGRVAGTLLDAGSYTVTLVGTRLGKTYGAPTTQAPTPAIVAAYAITLSRQTTLRLWGQDRYGTAASISASTFTPGVSAVYVATGKDFPDALVGGAVAGSRKVPVLLVTESGIPAATAAELARLTPGQIIILGSTSSVSGAVAAALAPYTTGGVSRIGADDRYAAAAAISAASFAPGVPVAYIATGGDFPDALAGAALGARTGGPILFVNPTSGTIPAATAAELVRLHPAQIVVLGGTGVVPAAVATALTGYTSGPVTRLWGKDRYETAAAISAANYAPGLPVVYIATGANFPDALAGAAAAGVTGGPVLLVKYDTIPASTAAELARLRPAKIVILGGAGVVSAELAKALSPS